MPNPKSKEPNAIELLAIIELMLSKLSQDHEAATYHRNSLIDECLSLAQEELLEAMNLILRGDAENSIRLCKIARLRIDFGRKLLDADAVEHLLGESEYLELAESAGSCGNTDPVLLLSTRASCFEIVFCFPQINGGKIVV